MIIQNHNKNIYPNNFSLDAKVKTPKGPNFSGPRLAHQSFENFEKFAKNTNFLDSIENILVKENYIGEGATHTVYKIPNNDTFLIRIPFSEVFKKKASLKKSKDTFQNNNLGQKIATIGKNIEIIIKQTGEPNGIKKWLKVFELNKFPEEELPEFIENLKKNSQMEEKAYNTLAEEIKLVKKKGKSFDFFNPQNILRDKDKQSFNLVDIGDEFYFKKRVAISSYDCILYSLLDENNFTKAYDLANDTQKKEMQNYGHEIKEKVKIASNKNSLSKNNFLFKASLLLGDWAESSNSLGEHIFIHKLIK